MSSDWNESDPDPRAAAAALRRELASEEQWMRRVAVSGTEEKPEPDDLVSWILRAARLESVSGDSPFPSPPPGLDSGERRCRSMRLWAYRRCGSHRS